jgi:hypothetical protein
VIGNSTVGRFAGGGGIASFGDVTLTNSTISGNSTAGDGSLGGGVLGDQVTLTNSIVSDNSTTAGTRAAAACTAATSR